jgi:hypothetical protein
MARCRFVKSGRIRPSISGLTAGQVATRRRVWFVEARLRLTRFFIALRQGVASFRSRLKRQKLAADRHGRGGEPEDSSFAHNV